MWHVQGCFLAVVISVGSKILALSPHVTIWSVKAWSRLHAKTCIGISIKCVLFPFDFNQNWNTIQQNSDFMKFHSVDLRFFFFFCLQVDRWTDIANLMCTLHGFKCIRNMIRNIGILCSSSVTEVTDWGSHDQVSIPNKIRDFLFATYSGVMSKA